MEDLSGRYPIRLVPTSQEAGGMVYDNSPAMTAPGSDPVTPMRTPYGAPMPFDTPEVVPNASSKNVPLSNEAGRTRGNPAPAAQKSGGGWTNTDDRPDAGGWTTC